MRLSCDISALGGGCYQVSITEENGVSAGVTHIRQIRVPQDEGEIEALIAALRMRNGE